LAFVTAGRLLLYAGRAAPVSRATVWELRGAAALVWTILVYAYSIDFGKHGPVVEEDFWLLLAVGGAVQLVLWAIWERE
jgi:hypothetical protein